MLQDEAAIRGRLRGLKARRAGYQRALCMANRAGQSRRNIADNICALDAQIAELAGAVA